MIFTWSCISFILCFDKKTFLNSSKKNNSRSAINIYLIIVSPILLTLCACSRNTHIPPAHRKKNDDLLNSQTKFLFFIFNSMDLSQRSYFERFFNKHILVLTLLAKTLKITIVYIYDSETAARCTTPHYCSDLAFIRILFCFHSIIFIYAQYSESLTVVLH